MPPDKPYFTGQLAALPFIDSCGRGVINAEACPRELHRELPSSRRGYILIACVVASSMAFIDGSVLSVALPILRSALGADLGAVQWVINGYVLAFAALTLTGGVLADAYGKARMLSIGCFLFGVASVACSLSPSISWLIAARVLEGIAAGLLTPASLALIGATYPKEKRPGAIGVWAAASSLTSASGPVLGGWLTQHFGWQGVFWINPPLAGVAIVLLVGFAPTDRLEPRRFDTFGALIIVGALGALTWALSRIGQSDSLTIASLRFDALLFAIGLAGVGCYALWERVSDHPMTPLRLWRNHDFVSLNVATLLIYAGLAIVFFLLPFDLIDRRGLSPSSAGLMFLPFTLTVGLLSPYFGGMADKFGARAMLITGALGAAVSYLWMILASDRGLLFAVIAPLSELGISFAILVAPLTAAVMSSLPKSDQGLASGVNNAAARIAQLLGVSVAAGLGALMLGFELGLAAAAAFSIAGAMTSATVNRQT